MFFYWGPARWEAKRARGTAGAGPPKVGWARRPAWFALDSPLTLCFRFSGANLGPGISGLEARRPAFLGRGLLPANREPLRLRSGEQILHTNSAPQARAGRLFQGAVCSPFSANPCSSVPGSKIFTQIPRCRPGPAAFSKAWFAPPSPRALAVPSRGANSSHYSRAAARGRPPFLGRGLLPASREPLRLRSGEQILHTNSAPQARAGRLFQGAVCSPLTANPCSSVPGSKIFTQIPRRRSRPAGFSKARFAPRFPRTLVAPFRGANSSHKSRAAGRGRPLFPGRGLLPPPREPLQLRSGEQILHTNSAPQVEARRLFQGAVCSPFSANPCSSVSGSKIFTQIPRHRPGMAGFSKARFAPR